MPTRSLPPRPNLEQLKLQANELHRALRDRDRSAAARVVAHHPEFRALSIEAALDRPLSLADAQLSLAREYGFPNWTALKQRVESDNQIGQLQPHPGFAAALAALDAGDVEKLRQLITADPTLLHARTNLEPPYGYFSGATLLHHVAGNPYRDNPLPANIVDIARVLLEAGADVHARTLGTNGGDTMGLLVTGKQASDMSVTGALMELLLQHGAQLNLTSDDIFDAPLANHSPAAARKMIELGAKPDVLVAAALGDMELLRSFFADDERLRSLPKRHGKELSARDAIGLAAVYAYVRDQPHALDFLLQHDGNWNVTGVNNGTLMHRAAWSGDLEMVKRLIAKGADISNRDNPFNSTPISWAQHNKQQEVIDWMRANCPIDLHDAVCLNFVEHVEARLREDPTQANRRRDQWELPQCTPLHWAAWTQIEDVDGVHMMDATTREQIARLLLANGADPNVVAGNGLTPLDIAEACGATRIAALLEERGGKRTTEAERPSSQPKLKQFERVARDLEQAYRTDDQAALQRLQQFAKQPVTFYDVRKAVVTRLQLDKDPPPEISIAQARDVIAGFRGFASWVLLAESLTSKQDNASGWGKPLYWVDTKENKLEIRRPPDDAEWDEILATMQDQAIEQLHAQGHMTDDVMARVAELDHIVGLDLSNSHRLTDVGIQHLAKLPRLQHLGISGCRFTDRGLEIFRQLTALRSFSLFWHKAVTDAGLANLTFCDQLERVDLMGTPVGDGVVNALTGKRKLRHFKTGTRVTDAGLPLFHRFPLFKTWPEGSCHVDLMSFDVDANFLLLDGPFTDHGMKQLAGLDGLVGLNLFWHTRVVTPAALETLKDLANLEMLGCHGQLATDQAMPHIAAIPRLRMLMAQGTVASDAGFVALSKSQTLEYIWGRECPNLTSRGFTALSSMPSLRGIAVSCKNVDDAALSTLPNFPALRQLLPMDVKDEGFRHVGRCENLERLWCMYCRDTTDVATEHIAGLSKLKTYYAGQTKITDRSLEILGRMSSLEEIEFWNCAGISNAGARFLVALPNLRAVTFDGCRQVTANVREIFGRNVRVNYSS